MNEAIFLLTSPEPDRKKSFGTGFAIAHKDGQLFLLTCAHVVEQLGGNILASGEDGVLYPAAVKAIGSSNAVDLALLSIPCSNPAPPLLNQVSSGQQDMRFRICGYSPHTGAKENYLLRDIQGRLGKSISFKPVGSRSIAAWDIYVEDDAFSRLQGGYSGSPLCDENGRLIAVVSHNADPAAGQRGHAIALANLHSIYPEIGQLMPSFASLNSEVLDARARIRQAMMQLSARASEIFAVMQHIGREFERMEKEGINEQDEELFATISGFVAGKMMADEFIRFFNTLDSRKKDAGTRPDFQNLADQLRKGQVILCIGQEFSHLLGAKIPSTAEIKKHLLGNQKGFHGPLSKLCEQKEIAPNSSRADLVNEIRALFEPCRQHAPLAFYELLARLEKPFLVISTAYDDLLEQSLRGRRNFAVISPDMDAAQCLLHCSGQNEPRSCTPEEISGCKLLENGYAVIYRLRGGVVSTDGHLLLSERDYFSFTRFMQQQFPDYIASRLKSSLYSLWFLGHHPESWEERLVIKSLQELRHDRASSLTAQENISPFARALWQDRKVKVYDLALREFIQELTSSVTTEARGLCRSVH